MRNLILVLPMMFLVLSLGMGSVLAMDEASGETPREFVDFHLLSAPGGTISIETMIPFAQTADDGGALLEKAKVRAMQDLIQ